MACGNDPFESGIYLGAEGLAIPLNGINRRSVASRLGSFLRRALTDVLLFSTEWEKMYKLQELKVIVGVYAEGEDIPKSGGVTDLGLY